MTTRAQRVDAIRNAEGIAREGLEYLDEAIALVVEEAHAGGEDGDLERALIALAHSRAALRQIRRELDSIEDAGGPEQPAVTQ